MEPARKIIQTTWDIFGDRLGDVEHMVRQDRLDLYGWEEPAHLRAVVRRVICEGMPSEFNPAELVLPDNEFARAAGEPRRGDQREAVGDLLEAGAAAMAKLARYVAPDLTLDECLGLCCVLLLYGRPAILIENGKLARVPAFWNVLEDQRDNIETVQRGVGRIGLVGHPEFDWAGTGFLVKDDCVLTTATVARVFAEAHRKGKWAFREGVSAWMDFATGVACPASGACRIIAIAGVDERHDLAVLEVEPQAETGGGPLPLSVSTTASFEPAGRLVYTVGIPARDARRGESERIARIFREVYNVKRVQPGILYDWHESEGERWLEHDCGMLGHSGGSCLVDLETHEVVGLHLHGRYLGRGIAAPMALLSETPLLRHRLKYRPANR